MHTNPVEELVVGHNPRLHYVMVHGRTLSPAYMRDLAARLDLAEVHYYFPDATDHSWYPAKFMDPVAANEPGLSAAIAHYEGIVTRLLEQGVDPLDIVVGGFSQGACLTAEYLARHPRRYGAAILWTGGLIGPEGTDWGKAALDGMPAYLTTSLVDPHVPAGRVRDTAKWLIDAGANVTLKIFEEREHKVTHEEIAAARRIIEAL